jgi:hypothetical protein
LSADPKGGEVSWIAKNLTLDSSWILITTNMHLSLCYLSTLTQFIKLEPIILTSLSYSRKGKPR